MWGGIAARLGLADEGSALLADEDGYRLVGDDYLLYENWETGLIDPSWTVYQSHPGDSEISVVRRTIAGQVDHRAAIRDIGLVQKFVPGTWTKLRLALRWSIQDSGADITNTPFFALGLCSGKTQPYYGVPADTRHFIGLQSRWTTWPRSVVGGAIAYDWGETAVDAPTLRWTRIQNGGQTNTDVTFGTLGNGGYFTGPESGAYRCGIALEFTRSGGDITLSASFARNTAIGLDVDEEEYLLYLDQGAIPTGHKLFNPAHDATFTVNEAVYGPLNCLNFYYGTTLAAYPPLLELSELALCKVS